MATTNDNAYYEIDPAGDLMIKVIEYNTDTTDGNGNYPVLKTATFKVSRQKLIDSSKHFRIMLTGSFQESSKSAVELHEDSILSMELWFRALHPGSFNDESYTIPRKEIWEAIWVSRKYFFELETLEPWFAEYWSRLSKKDLDLKIWREMLLPCQAFDHPQAFAYVTNLLAHHGTGHIQELNPTEHTDLHVEGRVIQQINAARGSMRKEIIKALFNPLNNFCANGCAVKALSLESYIAGVRKTGIWPLEDMTHKSNASIICSSGFEDFDCKVPEGACMSCKSRLGGTHPAQTAREIREYWRGLCLDCMDISKPKTGDLNMDYWSHNESKDWGGNCRLNNHGRNTWYFSFMGRPEIMSSFNRDQKDRKLKRGL